MKKRVEFDAHRVVKKATKVAFRRESGGASLHFREAGQGAVRPSFSAKSGSSRQANIRRVVDRKDRRSCIHKARQAR